MDREKQTKYLPPSQQPSCGEAPGSDDADHIPQRPRPTEARLRDPVWPLGRPLPLPAWDSQKPALHFQCVEQYEELASSVELQVQQLLQAHHYNTVGNFVKFYENFQECGEGNLEQFFRSYHPPISEEHYTCVGLSFELLRRLKNLETQFPGLSGHLYFVSCEEMIEDLETYTSGDPPLLTAEKEHVLLALRLNIGCRSGVLLLDPGYHIARVITVMKDGQYPHTGWFMQMDEPQRRKEYQYLLDARERYVMWHIKETRSQRTNSSVSLVYVERPFVRSIEFTERRNLIYNFKSLLCRDTKGHLVAGLYFAINSLLKGRFTLFYEGAGNQQQQCKIPFRYFFGEATIEEEEAIEICSQQLDYDPEEFRALLVKIVTIMEDEAFVSQLLDLNKRMVQISADN